MCGIIAIVRRRTDRLPPDTTALAGRLTAVLDGLPTTGTDGLAEVLTGLGERVAEVDQV